MHQHQSSQRYRRAVDTGQICDGASENGIVGIVAPGSFAQEGRCCRMVYENPVGHGTHSCSRFCRRLTGHRAWSRPRTAIYRGEGCHTGSCRYKQRRALGDSPVPEDADIVGTATLDLDGTFPVNLHHAVPRCASSAAALGNDGVEDHGFSPDAHVMFGEMASKIAVVHIGTHKTGTTSCSR